MIHDRCQGSGLKNSARLLQSGDQNRAILFLGEIIGVEQWRFIIISALDTHMAATFGPHLPSAAGHAGKIVEPPDESLFVTARREHQRIIRVVECSIALSKDMDQRRTACEDAWAASEPAQNFDRKR